MVREKWGKTISTLVSIIVFLVFFLHVASGDEKWTHGNFGMHIFKVGQGDSQLVISPSEKTLLIDIARTITNSGMIKTLVDDENSVHSRKFVPISNIYIGG